MTALSVRNIGKSFRSYRSELDRFAGWFGLRSKSAEEHWILRNINFDVHPGEAIGIVGQNGAGKSTLLKIITGTLSPTEGSVQINGRVAAILELGMGFNGELTGRENAFHAAGLMGFDQQQIKHVMPEIEEFAEIGEYFDEPMRIYSSGMHMRVAFAVATAYRPELLIIDEALSVGDAAFARKCFQRIEQFLESGTTLLFVSHDVESVKRLCEKAVFIKSGELSKFGNVKAVCDAYEKSLFCGVEHEEISDEENTALIDPSLISNTIENKYGDGAARIEVVKFFDQLSRPINLLSSQKEFQVVMEVFFVDDCRGVVFGMMLKTIEGIPVYATHTTEHDVRNCFRAGERIKMTFFLENNLAPGVYCLNVGVTHSVLNENRHAERRLDCLMLKVTCNSDQRVVSGYANLRGQFILSSSPSTIHSSLASGEP